MTPHPYSCETCGHYTPIIQDGDPEDFPCEICSENPNYSKRLQGALKSQKIAVKDEPVKNGWICVVCGHPYPMCCCRKKREKVGVRP